VDDLAKNPHDLVRFLDERVKALKRESDAKVHVLPLSLIVICDV
jgi:hypothetical protein